MYKYGLGASEGISIGKVFKFEIQDFEVSSLSCDNSEDEFKKIELALVKADDELDIIKTNVLDTLGPDQAMVFEAHQQILGDPELLSQVKDLIFSSHHNAAYAFDTVCETFVLVFESMDSDYMKERAADIKDIKKRVLSHILNIPLNDPTNISQEVIIVAHDLTPSDTVQLDKQFVKGFITNIGGKTSHSAIMARSMEIPAIVGTGDILDNVETNDLVIMNGTEGYIIIKPSKEQIKSHEIMIEKYNEEVAKLLQYKDKETITKDGVKLELAANIGNPEDLTGVLKYGAQGIGLYRTEFLYMNNNDFPTEDEQYLAYKIVLEKMKNQKVIIRTLDIGGDKELSYMKMDDELNPFLGHRALRLCLDRVDLFKTQLRALLRASVYGDLHIMFPMVATIDELRSAKKILLECKKELSKEDIKYNDKTKIGIMVEIPSVAILADQFAKKVDFFSIGTNDLIQYTFAADRMNQKVSYLYQPFNPSLLRLIKLVIDASHKEGIWTGMCGEMASDQNAVLLLVGLGLDEFSMSSANILKTRELIAKYNKRDLKELVEQAINLSSNDEVIKLIERFIKSNK